MAKELFLKIASATKEIGGFVADKRNVEQNYAYISADAVLDRAGLALAKNGVVVIPSIEEVETSTVERQNGKSRIDVMVKFSMTVTDGESEQVSLWYGRGSDYATPDKALYKAITSGHKYYLMKLLNISVGNTDSEHDEPEEPAPAVTERTALERVDAKNRRTTASMTLDEAKAITNRDGVRYGDIDRATLANMLNAMTKKGDPANAEKMTAARMILAEQNGAK